MEAAKTGWEHDKRKHFDDIVENYDKIRTGYPDKLFSDIFGFIGQGGKNALEIGAGTGKATSPFLNAGYVVTAVEIGENMAGFLREKFREYKGFKVIVSAFEDAALEEGGYDIVYAANAFHWVNAEIGCPKAFRILKSGGVFALFRYNGVPNDGDALYEEIQAAYEKHYRSYYPSSKRPVKDVYGQPAQILHRFGFSGLKDYGFVDVEMKLYDGTRTHSADEYIALLETMSDHRHLPESNRTALHAEIKDAVLRHGGRCGEDNTFQLYMGRKP